MQCEVSAPSPNEDVKKYFTNLTHWILNYTTDCTKAHKAMMMMIKTRGFALKHLEIWWLRETKVRCMKVWISLLKNLSWNGPFLWKSWACISYQAGTTCEAFSQRNRHRIIGPKMRFGHNFWLEGPIDLRPARLNRILQDLFRDIPLDHFWRAQICQIWPNMHLRIPSWPFWKGRTAWSSYHHPHSDHWTGPLAWSSSWSEKMPRCHWWWFHASRVKPIPVRLHHRHRHQHYQYHHKQYLCFHSSQ